MKKLILVLLLFGILLPSVVGVCLNCGVNMTSTKRLKYKNKSVFSRISGISLVEIYSITNMQNHELCSISCDHDGDQCQAFEFNQPNKLCVLAEEFVREEEDITSKAFQSIIFIKTSGLTKQKINSFVKEKEAEMEDKTTKSSCVNVSDYEEILREDVAKDLPPAISKNTLSDSSPNQGKPLSTDSSQNLGQGSDTVDGKFVSGSTSYDSGSEIATNERSSASTVVFEQETKGDEPHSDPPVSLSQYPSTKSETSIGSTFVTAPQDSAMSTTISTGPTYRPSTTKSDGTVPTSTVTEDSPLPTVTNGALESTKQKGEDIGETTYSTDGRTTTIIYGTETSTNYGYKDSSASSESTEGTSTLVTTRNDLIDSTLFSTHSSEGSSQASTTPIPIVRPGWTSGLNLDSKVHCSETECKCMPGDELRIKAGANNITAFAFFKDNGKWKVKGEEPDNVKVVYNSEILLSCIKSTRERFAPTCPLPIVYGGSFTKDSACTEGVKRVFDIHGQQCNSANPTEGAICQNGGYWCNNAIFKLAVVQC